MTKKVKKISLQIFLLPILMTLFAVFVSYVSVFIMLDGYFKKQQIQTQKEFFKDLKTTTKIRVDIAYNILATIYNEEIQKCNEQHIPKNICKQKILKKIVKIFDNFRWPNKGYIFILDFYGNTLYHPDHGLMKINRWNLTRNGIKVFQLLVNEAKKHPDGTYVRYLGYNFNKKPVWKVSYVKVFKPFDALVGSGVYINFLNERLVALQKKQQQLFKEMSKKLKIFSFLILFVSLIISYILAKIVQKMFLDYEKEIEKEQLKIREKSITDNLTGLFNRNYLKYVFGILQAKIKRENKKLAILFIDLDYFKEVNDTLGHKYGDILLKVISKRLKNVLRKDDILIRFGGDEFLVFIPYNKIDEVLIVIDRLKKAIKEKILINTKEINIDSSIGVSVYPVDSEDLNDLIKYADMAMYEAKRKGKGNFEFYKKELGEKIKEKTELKRDLIKAIENEEFDIYFQPKVSKDEHLYGSEVLIRWNHPKKGLLTPDKFLQIAYEKKLIKNIDLIVLKKAINQYIKWQEDGYNPGKISCNITMIDLQDNNFINQIEAVLNDNDFDSKNLILEVTEESIMKNPQKSVGCLNRLRNLGIGISIDDFGTGYSSLSYLKKFPLTELKIDKTFVKDIGIDRDDEEIVRIIILLGRVLNLSIVAEGVETNRQKEFLLLEGVDIIQGYLYSPPISASEFEEKFLKGF